MANNKNHVTEFGSNGLKFSNYGIERPRIQDIGDGDFHVSGLENGNIFIHKNDIDDLVILLREVKAHGYKIDYNLGADIID